MSCHNFKNKMKKPFLLLTSILLIIYSCLGVKPPDAVQKAFDQKFPSALNVSWGKESSAEYEAEFIWNGNNVSANFFADGSWLETETEIPVSQLPAKIVTSINNQYPGWQIVGADKIETPKKDTFYEADIKSGSKKKEVELKEDGTFIK
jgi:hypothetical protein